MPMIGRAVDDDIDVFALKNFAEVSRCERRRLTFRGKALRSARDYILLHIAKRHDIAEFRSGSQVAAALASAANQCNSRAIVGGSRSGARLLGATGKLALH